MWNLLFFLFQLVGSQDSFGPKDNDYNEVTEREIMFMLVQGNQDCMEMYKYINQEIL